MSKEKLVFEFMKITDDLYELMLKKAILVKKITTISYNSYKKNKKEEEKNLNINTVNTLKQLATSNLQFMIQTNKKQKEILNKEINELLINIKKLKKGIKEQNVKRNITKN